MENLGDLSKLDPATIQKILGLMVNMTRTGAAEDGATSASPLSPVPTGYESSKTVSELQPTATPINPQAVRQILEMMGVLQAPRPAVPDPNTALLTQLVLAHMAAASFQAMAPTPVPVQPVCTVAGSKCPALRVVTRSAPHYNHVIPHRTPLPVL
jgi:hypothetical protein